MPPRKAAPTNLMTADEAVQPMVTADTQAQYPHLSAGQIAALDRTPNDGTLTPGGSEPREPAPAVAVTEPAALASPAPQIGEVVKPGAPPPVSHGSGGVCRVRITKAGHGKVHTGQNRPKTYDWNAEVVLPRDIGNALEAKAYAEVLD